MSKRGSTRTAPTERRAGTYETDEDVVALLWYGTHAIIDLPKGKANLSAGTAGDCDITLSGDDISAYHFQMVRRSRGWAVTDVGSKNGLAYEVKRDVGLGLKPSFDDKRAAGEGFTLAPGMTFVVGAEPYRYVALDAAMHEHHPALVEILGHEDEIRTATVGGETPSPCDLILAAAGPGNLLITGEPGCEQAELARIIHKISKRRRKEIVEIGRVPEDREAQAALVKRAAAKSTLVLDLGKSRTRLDPGFVSLLFSPSHHVRTIVLARTASQARRALGHAHWRPLMHVALCPVARRKAAIHRLIDQWLAERGSALRIADLTPENQQALLAHKWRGNLQSLRETAARFDAIARCGFSRRKAAATLGIVRQTFYGWYGNTLKLTKPFVPPSRARALIAEHTARTPV